MHTHKFVQTSTLQGKSMLEVKESRWTWTLPLEKVLPSDREETALIQRFKGKIAIEEPAMINGKFWTRIHARDTDTEKELSNYMDVMHSDIPRVLCSPENLPAQSFTVVH